MRSLARPAAAIVLGLLLAGCASAASTPAPAVTAPGTHHVSTRPASPSPSSPPPASPSPGASYPASWALPDRALSPGAVQPGYGLKDICPHVNPALEAMRPSTAEKALVYRAYGIGSHPAGKYEIDHIIPIELLGEAGIGLSGPTRNLYPELNDTPDPAMLAKYHLDSAFVHNSKDILEDVLHAKVCAGTVPLATAQQAIASDWRAAYVTYVGPPPGSAPLPSPSRIHRSLAAPHPAPSGKVFSAPPAAHSSVPVQSACFPKTSGGNCYEPGEFCRKSDLGATGVAGNGERIRCEASGSRNRWEPA
jgi:hypothetical protein